MQGQDRAPALLLFLAGMGTCGAGCAAIVKLPALLTPPLLLPRGFLCSTGIRCTQGVLPEPPRQPAAVSALCLPWADALKAICGRDPAVASCAVGCGLHVLLMCVSVGFGYFFSTGFGLFGNVLCGTKNVPEVAFTCFVLFSLNFPFLLPPLQVYKSKCGMN